MGDSSPFEGEHTILASGRALCHQTPEQYLVKKLVTIYFPDLSPPHEFLVEPSGPRHIGVALKQPIHVYPGVHVSLAEQSS